MAVGLRVFNDDGISQISDQHYNMALVGKGTVNAASGGSNLADINGTYGKTINFVSSTPVIFAASAPSGAVANYTSKNGNTWTFSVLFGNRNETATWYAFSYPRNIPSNLGLRVFNEAGSLVYDAAQKPIRIAHYSAIDTPGMIVVSPNPNNIEQWPQPPPDIYVAQQRSNRTYASLGINMFAYRKAKKIRIGNAWLIGHTLFYYLPVTHSDGIRLQAREIAFAPANQPYPPGTQPYSYAILYQGSQFKQASWIIDVTGY